MQPPTPIFSFCKAGADFSDIMLPNTIEGDVFVRPLDKRAFRPRSRAGAAPRYTPFPTEIGSCLSQQCCHSFAASSSCSGTVSACAPEGLVLCGYHQAASWKRSLCACPHACVPNLACMHLRGGAGARDPRLPQAVWRGSTGGFGGLAKGRAALLNLGMQRPDLIDSGVLDWDAGRWGEHNGRLKEKMSFGEQARLSSLANAAALNPYWQTTMRAVLACSMHFGERCMHARGSEIACDTGLGSDPDGYLRGVRPGGPIQVPGVGAGQLRIGAPGAAAGL